MAKIKDVEIALQKAIEAIANEKTMKELGEQASGMIKLRTRLGYGVPSDGSEKERLRPLSPKTVERRKEAKRKGDLHGETSPGKSNLTETGQLLDSVSVRGATKDSVTIGPNGKRKDGLTNEEVGKRVSDGGRAFNHLSGTEVKRLQTELSKRLKAETDRQLTKLKK